MFVARVRKLAILALCATVVSVGMAATAVAQEAPANLNAALFRGSCAELAPFQVVSLRAVTATNRSADGAFQGLPSAMGVLSSESELRFSMSELLESPHAIVIGNAMSPSACGDIGGFAGDEVDSASFSIGIWPVGDSGVFGVASLAGNENGTGVHLHIAAPLQE